MASISWTEPSAFTRTKLEDGSPPLAWWVKPVVFIVVTVFFLVFPIVRQRPMNGSWAFTISGSFVISFLFVYAIPFIGRYTGDKWTLYDRGVKLVSAQSGGWGLHWWFWKWTEIAGYRLFMQEINGAACNVLEFYFVGGQQLLGVLGPHVSPDAVRTFLSNCGVPVADPEGAEQAAAPDRSGD